MVDSARHFLPVDVLKQTLDGMAASGLNVFHWHLTDAQSWPWDTPSRPKLVRGAYRPDLVYTSQDLEDVATYRAAWILLNIGRGLLDARRGPMPEMSRFRYAADRAIEVIPEIDMPGHAGSIAVGYPEAVVPYATVSET